MLKSQQLSKFTVISAKLKTGDIVNIKDNINSIMHTLFKIGVIYFSLISILLIFSTSAVADNGSGDSLDWGWILFGITLIILIIIVILWVVTYFIMRGVIKRLQADSDKIKRYESRKDKDMAHHKEEMDREQKRRARAPKGNCLVCNRKFIPGADAYQCDCGKFMHVHCLAEMQICPYCGRDINKDYGVVRMEDAKGVETHGSSRTKVNRLIKAKLCPVCNKIIKAGDSGIQCDRCETVMHVKCSDKTRKCPKCGA